MIKEEYLPEGFYSAEAGFDDVKNATTSYYYTFRKSPEDNYPAYYVFHQISVYENNDSAINAFSDWEFFEFSSVDKETEKLHFQPKDSNDKYILRCQVTENVTEVDAFCLYLQQHENLIIFASTAISNNNITYEEFDQLLEKLDELLPSEGVLTSN
jgi:hypothetical protein